MVPPPLFLLCAGRLAASAEPDGSRTVGVVPPYQAQPAPPSWLRGASHCLAVVRSPHARHYVYEAYGDSRGQWLVRYLELPAAGERVGLIQQVFLFGSDPLQPPELPGAKDVQFRLREARCGGREFRLVDRRDLLLRAGPVPPPR
jgi:hypothetical protein